LQDDDVSYLFQKGLGQIVVEKWKVVNGKWQSIGKTNDFNVQVGLNRAPNPFSNTPFYMYEARLRKPSNEFGFGIDITNTGPIYKYMGMNIYDFPAGFNNKQPSTWANAKSSELPIPDLPFEKIFAILASTLMGAEVFSHFSKRNKNHQTFS